MKNGKHIDEYGSEWCSKNGKLHRDNGPAVTYADGSAYWYQNGKLHRDNGPAAIYADGAESWYQNGKLHRDDGPAEVWAGGTESWYQNGIELTESQILILREKIGFNNMMKDLLTT